MAPPLTRALVAGLLAAVFAAVPASADRIAYTSWDRPFPEGPGGTDANIWLIDPDSGSQVQLTRDPADDRQAAWSPDGGLIAFASSRAGSGDIWITSTSGFPQVRLTRGPGQDGAPQFSPGGRTIAFIRGTGDGSGALWVMAADGSRARRLIAGGCLGEPRWSPDGRRIAVTRRTGDAIGDTEVWVIRADGRAPRRIGVGRSPAWSPDGRLLAFGGAVHVSGGGPLLVARTSGRPRTRAVTAIAGGQPDWLPGGRALVYVHNTGGDAESVLRRVDLDGTGDIALTSGPGWSAAGPGEADPEVSPDGRRVAFMSISTEPFDDIAVVGVAGGDQRLLAHDGLPDADPAWQPR